MKRPNAYALYLCHDAVQSDAEAAAKKAKANEEWYEHNKQWKKEYNQEYYQKNKEYWENYYKEQKSSAERAEENMKRAQQEYADYTKKNSTGAKTTARITKLGDGNITKTSSSAKTVKGSTTTSSKTTPVTSSTKAAASSTTSDKKDYDLSTITKDEMDLANKVIRGDFSVGKKRKELLKKYIEEKKLDLDPVKIQRYVNRLAKVGYNWNKSGIKTPGGTTATNAATKSTTKSSSKSKSNTSTKKTAKLKSSTSNKTTKNSSNKNKTTKNLLSEKLANDSNAQAKAAALYNH